MLDDEGARAVEGVSTSSPLDDFRVLLDGGRADQALSDMQVGCVRGVRAAPCTWAHACVLWARGAGGGSEICWAAR